MENLSLQSDTIEATGWIKRDTSLGDGEKGRRREKSFSGDLFNQMARGGWKNILLELSFIY